MSSVLRNPRYELFAQGVAAGLSKQEAYQKAGFTGKSKFACNSIASKGEIKQRINELLRNGAVRSELSRRDILDRIKEDWDTSRNLGQMASALKAAELLGRELKMFIDRKEVGGPGDFDGKSEDELRQIIQKELGDLGWDEKDIPPSAIN
jgi:phage terminase small subunit